METKWQYLLYTQAKFPRHIYMEQGCGRSLAYRCFNRLDFCTLKVLKEWLMHVYAKRKSRCGRCPGPATFWSGTIAAPGGAQPLPLHHMVELNPSRLPSAAQTPSSNLFFIRRRYGDTRPVGKLPALNRLTLSNNNGLCMDLLSKDSLQHLESFHLHADHEAFNSVRGFFLVIIHQSANLQPVQADPL